jgi:small subunit ribosomal protein S16
MLRIRLARFGRKVSRVSLMVGGKCILHSHRYSLSHSFHPPSDCCHRCLHSRLPQNLPFYRIFVADSRSPRDGRHVEQVGHYDPVPEKDGNKHLGLNIERIRYWLSVGAQPSDTVARLLGQAGVIPRPPAGLHCGKLKNPDKHKKSA